MGNQTWRDQALYLAGNSNLKILVSSNTQVGITADQVVLRSSDTVYVATSVSLTATISSSGVNGLDTGSEASNTWYSVWVIYNGTTVASLLSTSATAPTMPSGYTFKARIGWVRNNASANLYRTQQNNNIARYIIGTNPSAGIQMDSAVTGNTTTPIQAIDISPFIPETAIMINGFLFSTNSGACAAPNSSYGGNASTTNPPPAGTKVSSNPFSLPFNFLLESTNIYWASNGSDNAIYVTGWEDNI